MNNARVNGWHITFRIEGATSDSDPVDVVVEGEIGDPQDNTWDDDDPVYYESEESAVAIARDTVFDVLGGEIPPSDIIWIQTERLHPDHYMGKKRQDIGVWA